MRPSVVPERSFWPGLYSTVICSPDTSITLPVALGEDHVAGVAGGAGLDAGADVGRLGDHQRHGLLLHVGAHEGPVGVVVLDEGDERGRDRHDLLRRHVHQVDLGGRHEVDLAGRAVGGGGRPDPHAGALGATADQHALLGEAAVVVEGGVGLGDDVLLLLVGGQVHDLVGHPAVDHLAVRRLDEPVLVDPGVGGEVRRSGRCSGPRGSRSGTSGRSGRCARLGPRSRPAHGTGRRARAPTGAACGPGPTAGCSGP